MHVTFHREIFKKLGKVTRTKENYVHGTVCSIIRLFSQNPTEADSDTVVDFCLVVNNLQLF